MTENYFFHFTNPESAKGILYDGRINGSLIKDLNDPFDIDNNPVVIDFENDDLLYNFCEKFYRRGINGDFPNLPNRTKNFKNSKDPVGDLYKEYKSLVDKNFFYVYGEISIYEDIKKSKCITSYSFLENCGKEVLLWSHYARKHTGVAFCFDPSFCNKEKDIFEVDYPEQNIRGNVYSPDEFLDFLSPNKSNDWEKRYLKKTALIKNNDWKYEQEWRTIGPAGYYQPLDNKFKAIYLGLEISPLDKFCILSIVDSKYPRVKVYAAKKNLKYIRLDFDEINIEEELSKIILASEPA